MKLHLLIDTSVWLDIVQDARQFAILEMLTAMIEAERLTLILPQIVVDEFNSNRDRVIAESRKSIKSHFRPVRQAIAQFGAKEDRDALIQKLNEIDHLIGYTEQSVNEALYTIDETFGDTDCIGITDEVKRRAADRAITKSAPFHRQRNSMADAILLKSYVDKAA
ncbi:hypothetical protein MMA231_04006 (plasmid) [Asticcacaulis sp. MM231]|uniref:PIN domain-containing protein n=1 Tax=Asticcacaulis sp. MM231 TaxID=3157666 RepID=UPI0032D57CB0